MQKKEKKKVSVKRIIIIILVTVLALFIIAGSVLVNGIYSSIFKHVSTSETRLRTVDEFTGLKVEECTFPSNHGQKLAGYKYSKEDLKPKGIVIIAHGLGPGGQCVYMDTADYFTSNGYLVFAYDTTGMDKSEGDSAIGMEQGVIDLDYAIRYVEQDSEMKNYPVALFGHSWGAYSVSTVLNIHPEVKAVVSVSGFNKPSDFYKTALGSLSPVLRPCFMAIEKIKFGKYTDYSSLSGFAATKAGIMVIQSKDDRNVPETCGYDLYYAKYKDDPRFRFQLYENRGHLFIFYTDAAREYDRRFMQEQNGALTEYGQTHDFDKSTGYEIDPAFYAGILDFYNTYCK